MKSSKHPMMYIKNYITGGTAIVLSLVCLFAILQGGYEKRIMYAAVVLFIAGAFSLWTAVRAAKLDRESISMREIGETDEKMDQMLDQMLVWQVIDRLLFSVTLVFILLYGILKTKIYLWIGTGVCAATVILLVLLFVARKMQTKE